MTTTYSSRGECFFVSVLPTRRNSSSYTGALARAFNVTSLLANRVVIVYAHHIITCIFFVASLSRIFSLLNFVSSVSRTVATQQIAAVYVWTQLFFLFHLSIFTCRFLHCNAHTHTRARTSERTHSFRVFSAKWNACTHTHIFHRGHDKEASHIRAPHQFSREFEWMKCVELEKFRYVTDWLLSRIYLYIDGGRMDACMQRWNHFWPKWITRTHTLPTAVLFTIFGNPAHRQCDRELYLCVGAEWWIRRRHDFDGLHISSRILLLFCHGFCIQIVLGTCAFLNCANEEIWAHGIFTP